MLKLVAVLLLLPASVNALYLQDSLEIHEPGYQLLTDFCFGSRYIAEAKLVYNLLYPSSYAIQKLFLVPNEQWGNGNYSYAIQKLFLVPNEQWGNGNYSCTDLKYMLQNAYVIELHPGIDNSGCVSLNVDDEEHYNCTNSVVLASEIPRRWYIAIARCYPSMYGMEGLKLTDFSLRMTNGFSEDEADGCFGDYYVHKHFNDDDDDDGDGEDDFVHGEFYSEDILVSAGTSNNAQWTPAIILTAAVLYKVLF